MPELRKTKDSFSELSEEEAKQVLEKFNLDRVNALLPSPEFVNTYNNLFESIQAATSMVRMSQELALNATKNIHAMLAGIGVAQEAVVSTKIFALGITSEVHNIKAFAIGMSLEVNGLKNALQVVQSTNESWSKIFDNSFLLNIPDISRLLLPPDIDLPSSPRQSPSLLPSPITDLDIDFAYIEQVREEEDEIRRLKLQYWRHKVSVLEAGASSNSKKHTKKKLPSQVEWVDGTDTIRLVFQTGEELAFTDPLVLSAKYFRLLINNYGLPIKHTDAAKILSCTKTQVRNLKKTLTEKIKRAELSSKVILNTELEGAYQLEFLI